jgi:drug/metabolite transporter (DMT)-like permease
VPTEQRKSYRGYIYIAISAFLWGVGATLGRAAFNGRLLPGRQGLQAIDPLILSQARITFAFLIFLPVLLISRGRRPLRVPAADLGRLVLLGVLGLAASNYTYYLAIQRTNIATAITVQYTAPVWVLLYAALAGWQKPSLQRVTAAALAVVGIGLVIGAFQRGGLRLDLIGVVASLAAAFAFAFYSIAGHGLVARYDHWIVLLYATFAGSVFWLAINPPGKVMAAHYSASQWLFLLSFSLVSMLLPYSFYFAGLKYLEPTRAVIVSCLEPAFAIAIAAAALGEVMRPLQVLGIAVVLAAIVIVQLPSSKDQGNVSVVEPIQ